VVEHYPYPGKIAGARAARERVAVPVSDLNKHPTAWLARSPLGRGWQTLVDSTGIESVASSVSARYPRLRRACSREFEQVS